MAKFLLYLTRRLTLYTLHQMARRYMRGTRDKQVNMIGTNMTFDYFNLMFSAYIANHLT